MNKLFNLKNGLAYVIVTLIAMSAFHIVIKLHPHMDELIKAAYGVIEGKPHWIAYQNRILGPYLILLFSKLGISFKVAWLIFTALSLEILCLLIYRLLRSEGCTIGAALSFLMAFVYFFITFQNYWFFAWDSIDLVIFSVFAYGVLKSKPMSYFVMLFFLSILNRESALFIAAYFIIDAFHFDCRNLRVSFKSFKNMFIGVALIVLGMVYTKWIRHVLFVSQANGNQDKEHELIGNHIYLASNMKDFFINNFSSPNYLFSTLILCAFFYFLSCVRKMHDSQFKCLLVMVFLFLNIMVFGIVNETRMHFVLLPFALFLFVSMNVLPTKKIDGL